MEAFRNFVKSWFGKVLLVLFTIPFAAVGLESLFMGGSNSAQVAQEVNGEPISREELNNEIKTLHDSYFQAVRGDVSLLNYPIIDKQALDGMIARVLLRQQAEKLGIALSDAQIEQMLAQSSELQENGVFSQQKYEQYLKETKQTNQTFVNSIRQGQAVQMLIASVGKGFINPKDVQQIIQLANEERRVHLASISLAEFKKNVQVTDQEVSSYYDQHKQEFVRPAEVNVDYIVISPQQLNLTGTVTDEELNAAYQQLVKNLPKTVKHILITTTNRTDAEAEKLANEIYAKIQAGESFANAAKTYSEDTTSKDKGGLIAGYTTGTFSNSFDQAVKNATVGQVSKPIKTNYGYHLISTESSTKTPTLDSIKTQLTEQVKQQKLAAAFSDKITQLNEMVLGSDSLDVIQQEVKGSTIESATNISPLTQHPQLGQAIVKSRLFGAEVKEGDRHVSGNINLPNGDVIWVKVKQYTPAGVQEFDQVKEQVQLKVIQDKAVQAAQAKVKPMLEAFKTRPAKEVLSEHAVKFEDAGLLLRGKQIPQVDAITFSLATPKTGQWSVGTTALNDDLILIAVSEVKHANAAQLTEQKAEYKQLYSKYYAERELDDYIAYLRSIAKLKTPK